MLSVALACVYVGVQTDDEQGTKKEAKLIRERGVCYFKFISYHVLFILCVFVSLGHSPPLLYNLSIPFKKHFLFLLTTISPLHYTIISTLKKKKKKEK